MKICWFGTYNKNYSRNDILLNGLLENEVQIAECQADPKSPTRFRELRSKLRGAQKECDLVYAAYPADVPVILAKMTSKKPVVMDAFYPMFDAVVRDRREIPWFHPRALKLLALDWISAMLADLMIVDTLEHKKYWSKFPFVSAKKIHPIYIGANDRIFHPLPANDSKDFLVTFHGTFIPLQGLDKIVKAADILRGDTDIKFLIIGGGQEEEKIDRLIADLDLRNIGRIGRISQKEINEHLNRSDVVMGIFGDSKKAFRVIPNKVYEGMAAGRTVITMDSPAAREVFKGDEICLVRNTPEEIAAKIRELKNDPKLNKEISQKGYNYYKRTFTPRVLGQNLVKVLNQMTIK